MPDDREHSENVTPIRGRKRKRGSAERREKKKTKAASVPLSSKQVEVPSEGEREAELSPHTGRPRLLVPMWPREPNRPGLSCKPQPLTLDQIRMLDSGVPLVQLIIVQFYSQPLQ